MTERAHRSYSQLSTHQKCGTLYRFRYVEKIPLGSSVPAIRGLSVHASAAHNFKQKIRSRRDVPLREVTDFAAQEVDSRFAGTVHLTKDEMTVGVDVLRSRVKDIATSLARVFHLRAAPHVQPLLVEERIRVRPAADVLPVDLVAVVDLYDDKRRLHDLKTKEKTPAAGDEHHDQQLTMGAMLIQTKTGSLPTEVGFDMLVQEKNPAVPARHLWRPSTRTQADVSAMIQTLAETERAIQSGSAPPTDPRNWWCSEKWCGYWFICPYVAGRRGRS